MEYNNDIKLKNLHFSKMSFMLYVILPEYKKIEYINRGLHIHAMLNDAEANVNMDIIALKLYREHLSNFTSSFVNTQVGITSYITNDNHKVNIFIHNNIIHINSSSLIPIKQFVTMMLLHGNIIIRDYSYKKTKHNSDKFHLRYYRAYKKINVNDIYPIVLS